MICKTVADIHAAALADHDGPLTQAQADMVALLLAPHTSAAQAA